MKVTLLSDIFLKKKNINTVILINGWVRNRRDSKSGISFLDIYDGSIVTTLQVIAKNTLSNYVTEILKLTIGCSVKIVGKLIHSLHKKNIYELKAHLIQVIGTVSSPKSYPMSAKRHTLEHLRNFCHLRPRTNIIGVISRIRNTVFYTLHKFFQSKQYLWVATPIITSINTEGGGDMFKISMLDTSNYELNKKIKNFKKKFFNRSAFLTVSGQLTLEAYACSLSKVYSFGPVFRAENSNTKKHLAEFWMLEMEKAFTTVKKISNFSEILLKHVIQKVLEKNSLDLSFLKKYIDNNIFIRLKKILNINFFHIEYKEALDILLKNSHLFSEKIFWGIDFNTIQEKYLVEEYFKAPVVIYNYPKNIKPFYMKLNSDEITVSAFDILFPLVGEIIGGSEREDRFSILENRMKIFKETQKDYHWYQDLRKYGTIPHAGFGLGFERLILYITGLNNIRDVIPFPRSVGDLKF
ncbi:asparagine--tRNA ligase [Buchnera aphidicola]|uniref:Asparagine--tRNA ligase n=1 Tax=Buchnera aphidicola subsp. Tuberolachnus salignus TaxID=98804 RepID=A0A160SYA4_BUCTT|nr:asparagine--tRNA ligase [Buchnera aphidicola]CUR53214.1 Asparagine--tRNA ligase [Buchnera aphidicola (Tuberolachnus salignus)]